MAEEWRPVINYEDRYMISRTGKCVNIKTQGGKPKWRALKATPNTLGYIRYALSEDSDRRDLFAHRLVWEAFVGPIPDELQINHKNGIKNDNRLDNLEVVTCSANNKHKFEVLGCKPNISPNKGGQNGRAKLTEKDIPKIRKMLASGMTQTAISKVYGVNQTQISLIALGKGWSHIK